MTIVTKLIAQTQTLEITLASAPANLLTLAALKQLGDIFESCSQKDSLVRSVVIKSALPNVFCMGLDPMELLPLAAKDRAAHFRELCRLIQVAISASLPIICIVNGPAMAGGAVLASLAHYRFFQAQAAKFSFSESKVFLPVPGFVQELIKRAAGVQHLFEIIVMAKNYDAKAALSCGFAHDLYDNETDLELKIADLCSKIFRLDRQVLKATLLQGSAEILQRAQEFLLSPEAFEAFLGDDFFGKGLKQITQAK